MFPGYVLINMVMNDDTWYVVRNTRGVTGFVGPGSKPVPLTEAEIETVGNRIRKYRCRFCGRRQRGCNRRFWKDTVGVIQSMNSASQSSQSM